MAEDAILPAEPRIRESQIETGGYPFRSPCRGPERDALEFEAAILSSKKMQLSTTDGHGGDARSALQEGRDHVDIDPDRLEGEQDTALPVPDGHLTQMEARSEDGPLRAERTDFDGLSDGRPDLLRDLLPIGAEQRREQPEQRDQEGKGDDGARRESPAQ